MTESSVTDDLSPPLGPRTRQDGTLAVTAVAAAAVAHAVAFTATDKPRFSTIAPPVPAAPPANGEADLKHAIVPGRGRGVFAVNISIFTKAVVTTGEYSRYFSGQKSGQAPSKN